jgi:hypothetical protein
VRRLPITPSQAYVLSLVDGAASVIELSLLTGLSRDELESTIERLVEMGAVRYGDAPTPPRSSSPPADTSKVAAQALADLKGPARETYSVPPGPLDPRSLYDPSELDEEVDIPPERRRRILDLYYALEELTYYDLLGVPFDADKKRIKDAYFALAAELHPDRYFRKNLGSFKAKMELVFGRITLAHDTLTRKALRAEYDAYIDTQLTTRKLEASTARDTAALEAMRQAVESRAQVEEPPRVEETAGPAQAAVPVQLVMDERTSSVPPHSAPPVSRPDSAERDRMRRELLARRLLGGRASVSRAPGPARSSSPAPGPTRASSPAPGNGPVNARTAAAETAAADLKRRYAERQATLRQGQLKEAMKVATDAMDREDHAAAANALAVAVELAPDDEAIQARLAEVQGRVARALALNYLKQARYEERTERWKDAAKSYTRAAETLTRDAQVQERAANAILMAAGDLHAAGVFARRAVELEPKRVEYRATLARVYVSGGLTHSARKELEIAAALAPGDGNIAKLLKSVR